MQSFVPKHRRPRFDLSLEINDLNNVPLVSGAAYVKWHLPHIKSADSRGRSTKEPIKDHKVTWGYSHVCQNLRMTIDRNGFLQEQNIEFEINQEYYGARERILLGTLRLNLAEYAGAGKQTRRYLMQDSKINSTIRITVLLSQTGGDTNFKAPLLKGAQVFGNIAGILGESSRETPDLADAGKMSALTSATREAGAVQDMYRRTLAASWQLQAGELNAEECIENIFAGGDGWKSRVYIEGKSGSAKSVHYEGLPNGSDSDSLSAGSTRGGSTLGGGGGLSGGGILKMLKGTRRKDTDALSIMTTATIEPQRKLSDSSKSSRSSQEIDEMEARKDFVSWRIPSR